MTITINRSNYIDLLNEVQLVPKVIETEVEYVRVASALPNRFLAVTENLLSKQQSRTPEEAALFMLLVKLIEDYSHQVSFVGWASPTTSTCCCKTTQITEINLSETPPDDRR
jgi:hypothetical protein